MRTEHLARLLETLAGRSTQIVNKEWLRDSLPASRLRAEVQRADGQRRAMLTREEPIGAY